MKKLLLFGLALGLSFGAMADGTKDAKKTTKTENTRNKIEIINPTQTTPVTAAEFNLKGTQSVERVYIGKSANAYSVLLEEQRGLDYNDELGTYAFTFRTDPATYPAANNSGNIISATSQDGDNWTDTWLVNTDDAGRYPSGVVFNPDGNTDPTQALVIGAGPVSTGTWTHNFFSSSKIKGEDLDLQLLEVDPAYSGSQLIRQGMQATTDGYAHIMGSKYQDNGSGYSTEMNLNTWYGEYNGSTFDWEAVDVPVDLKMRTDGTTFNFWTFGSAWANDGSVGYMWMIGVTADIENGYQPVVFMTTDKGESWDEIEVELEDNEVMSEYIWATNGLEGPMWPQCTELDGVVDANGELQLFVKATGTFSTHIDSLGYSYTNNLNYIYNIELNEDGIQDVIYVDSIVADDVPTDGEYALGGAAGWGSRLRASRTADGSAVFAVWTDSEDPESTGGENANPNIKAAGRMINGDFNDFPTTNFTADDLYAGFYYFINVGQIAKIANNEIHIPVTTSVSPAEFGTGDELTPTTHSFVKGVKFPWTVGVNNLDLASSVSVSQNNPNPFTGSTTIELTSNTVAPVMIEVSNLMGQTVYTMNAGTINNSMKVELPARDLQSGVYFYTVTIGGESVSKKMIVE